MAKRDYLVDAAKQIRLALDREVSEDYEAAFSYYKNGVDLLLSGVQVDPNKERREAVKRKTTQYLKRAEEIFISHLQDSLGKGTSQFGGYSSLRFRPIRNLSSPVEDLEMCKVVGIIDKVLFVQSLISKETFVVKSLPKSSGACREHPTIIPQGIPFMVKLLRYYVSEDSVYLHLEHIQGGRLFSKLHTFRSEALREHPECCGPRRHKIRLKNSYTSPAIGQECHRNGTWSSGMATLPGSESPDTDSLTSWDETQHQLESCQTHSYCEETGCLQNSRTGKSHLSLIIQTDDVQSRRFPADARFPYPKSQENLPPPIHPCVIVDTRDPLCVTSDLLGNDVRIERIESSLDFDVAWNAAGSTQDGGNSSSSLTQEGESIPQITPTSMCGGGSQPDVCDTVNIQSQRIRIISNTLQLPIQNQSQDSKRTTQASCWQSTDVSGTTGLGRDSPPGFREELSREDAMLDCRTSEPWDRSERSQIATGGCSGNPRSRTISPHHLEESQLLRYRSSSPHVTLVNVAEPSQATTAAVKEVGMEAVEAKDEGQGVHGPLCRPSEMDSLTHLLAPSAYASQQEPEMDQLIEVDGWCHLPQFKARGFSARPKQGRWGMPEDEVRIWGAQILLALEGLHEQGILCQDLNPNNILLNSNGKVCLTFFGLWSEVQSEISPKAMEQMYCAPEIGGVSKITEACDWWSLGALLFELLTGMPLWQCHPAGVRPHTQLLIPDHLSTAAASLLTELLQFDAGYRLGCGGGGVSDIKCHPFFNSVPWHALAGPP